MDSAFVVFVVVVIVVVVVVGVVVGGDGGWCSSSASWAVLFQKLHPSRRQPSNELLTH